MKTLRRQWRVAKWIGLGLSIALGLALVTSIVSELKYVRTRGPAKSIIFGLSEGAVGYGEVGVSTPKGFEGWSVQYSTRDFFSFARKQVSRALSHWWPYSPGGGGVMVFPLSLPFIVVAVATASLFWLDRRRLPPHCCQACGYDLTGNVSGICPECGSKPGGPIVQEANCP